MICKLSQHYSGVARGGGRAASPGCHHFGITPYFDVIPKLHRFGVITLLFSLCLVVLILIWTKNPLIFRRRLFSLVFTYFWYEKGVPPQNPAPGATILINTSATCHALNFDAVFFLPTAYFPLGNSAIPDQWGIPHRL